MFGFGVISVIALIALTDHKWSLFPNRFHTNDDGVETNHTPCIYAPNDAAGLKKTAPTLLGIASRCGFCGKPTDNRVVMTRLSVVTRKEG
jgi:hypothetical protein